MPKLEHKAVIIGTDDSELWQIQNRIASGVKVPETNVKLSILNAAKPPAVTPTPAADSKVPEPVTSNLNYDIVLFIVDAKIDAKVREEQIARYKELKLTYKEQHPPVVLFHHVEFKRNEDRRDLDPEKIVETIYGLPPNPRRYISSISNPTTSQNIERTKTLIKEMEEKLNAPALVAAFRKIYNALYAGQSSWFKSANFADSLNSLSDVKALEAIKRHAAENSQNRTAHAWFLAQQHLGEDISSKNEKLFKQIYKYAYMNSSWLFKRSQSTGGDTLFKARTVIDKVNQEATKIDSKNDNSRAGKIRLALEPHRPASS